MKTVTKTDTGIDISFITTDSKAALYERTADWFRKHPDQWITGCIMSMYKEGLPQAKPCFCAVGGMHAALTDPPRPRKIEPLERDVLGLQSPYLEPLRDIDVEKEVTGIPYGDIVTFNDGPCTDVNHLIETLDKIAAAIRVKDGTTKPAPKPDFSILEGSKAKLYEAGANWLETHPGQWTRWNLITVVEGKPLFCAIGSMHAAMTDPPKPRLLTTEDVAGSEWENVSFFAKNRDFAAEYDVCGTAYGLPDESRLHYGIVNFNDTQDIDTGASAVIAKLREIASYIRAKEALAAVTVPNLPKSTGKRFSKAYQPSTESKAKVMAHVYRKRLLKVADVTDEAAAKERFYFGSYVGGKNEFYPGEGWQGKANLSCGTSACAMGWATTVPAFRRLGLQMYRSYKSSSGFYSGRVCLKGSEGQADADVLAGEKLFGISRTEYYSLFIPSSPTEVKTVNANLGITLPGTTCVTSGTVIAQRIRDFANAKFPPKGAKKAKTSV